MLLISAAEMQAHERAVIATGVSAADLMGVAGAGIANCLRHFFPQPGTLVCYCGRGNNAGDALVAARLLRQIGWRIAFRLSSDPESFTALPAAQWKKLGPGQNVCTCAAEVLCFHRSGPLVLLDGLIGLGSIGPLRPELHSLAAEMNQLRRTAQAEVIAIDLPSGLNPDTGESHEDTVIADLTTTIAITKAGLVADSATPHVGRLVVIPLPALEREKTDPIAPEVLTPALLRPLLPRRAFDMHKGAAGRVGIIAGSSRFPGAAVLCSLGALRGGAGLITLFCKADTYSTLSAKLPPEIMLRCVSRFDEALQDIDILAIGPGLGADHDEEIVQIIASATQPMVVDADALNALSRRGIDHLHQAQGPRLLTPHPGEMARLTGRISIDRRREAERLASLHRHNTVLLKGSRTVIATPGHPSRYNTTGHPGMASGGMGDVLTGLLAALLAQGASPHDAASLGAWLLGRAAELALLESTISPESLSATDTAHHLGSAFQALRRLSY